MSASSDLYRLAVDMDQFYWDYDTYGYWDVVESREEGVEMIYNLLLVGEVEGYTESIRESVRYMIEDDPVYNRSLITLGKSILRRLDEYFD